MLTRKPLKGDLIRWPDWPEDKTAEVLSIDGNLCWIKVDERKAEPFIWFFPADVGKSTDVGRNEGRNILATIVRSGIDRDEKCANCRDPRWKHKHDQYCQNLVCSCLRFVPQDETARR